MILVAILTTGLGGDASNVRNSLVARWTFKDGSLTSDNGTYTFLQGGHGTLETANGSVTLRDHKLLMIPEISSNTVPSLTQSVTIWARLNIEALPEKYEIGLMGLQDSAAAGDWSSLIFTLLYRAPAEDAPKDGLAFIAQPMNTAEMGIGASAFQPVSTGNFFDVAITFDGETQTAGMWVSTTGQLLTSRMTGADRLKDFSCFGIGQLKSPGVSCAVTFAEVRIYSEVLDLQQLEEISASENK